MSVLLNSGNGTFAAPAAYAAGARYLSVAELNGDGKLDLATVGSSTVSVLLNNGNGTFAAKLDYPTNSGVETAIAAADLNDDGRPDLATTGDLTVSVLLNTCLP